MAALTNANEVRNATHFHWNFQRAQAQLQLISKPDDALRSSP